jgi:hypothetical protein
MLTVSRLELSGAGQHLRLSTTHLSLCALLLVHVIDQQAKSGVPRPPRPGVGETSPTSSPVDSAGAERREAGIFSDAYHHIKGTSSGVCDAETPAAAATES